MAADHSVPPGANDPNTVGVDEDEMRHALARCLAAQDDFAGARFTQAAAAAGAGNLRIGTFGALLTACQGFDQAQDAIGAQLGHLTRTLTGHTDRTAEIAADASKQLDQTVPS